jgi:hypothetical protein
MFEGMDKNPTNVPQPTDFRSVLTPHVPKNRSRVSNNREILQGVDQRSGPARRYRDLISQIAVDQGGADRCSEAKMQLIRRFAAAAVLAEALEAKLVNGEDVSIAEHAQLSSTLVRLAQRIGLSRHARLTSPSLSDVVSE